jgi:HEAT repeat protein
MGAGLLVLLAAVVLLLPGSPTYLPDLVGAGGMYDGHSTGYWIRAANSPDAAVRFHAIHALGAIGPEAGDAVPTLSAILSDSPSAGARIEAALALSKMGPPSRAALPALTRALDDPEPFVRMDAALALFRLGAEARPAVPALIEALDDPRNRMTVGTFPYTIRALVARALGRASAGTADGVPALTAALELSAPEDVRLAVARALGEVGPPARPAEARLRALLADPTPEVVQVTWEALAKIADEPAAAP